MQFPPHVCPGVRFLRRATKDKNHLQFVLWQHLLVNQGVKSLSTAQMTDLGDDTSKKESKISKETTVSLPAFEDRVRHDSAILMERESTAKMAAAGLLEVARGGEHPSFKELSMKPMHLPQLSANRRPHRCTIRNPLWLKARSSVGAFA